MDFDYNKLLNDASGVLSSKTHTEERLKVPEPEIIYEGKATIIRNFLDITEMLNRNPEDLVKYLTKEFGIGANISGRRLVINRKLREEEINDKLNAYMATYVMCYECSSPDTTIEKAVSKMVSAGFYKSVDEAYEQIIREAWRNNLISAMLKNTNDEYSRIESILDGEKKYDKL